MIRPSPTGAELQFGAFHPPRGDVTVLFNRVTQDVHTLELNVDSSRLEVRSAALFMIEAFSCLLYLTERCSYDATIAKLHERIRKSCTSVKAFTLYSFMNRSVLVRRITPQIDF